ncbi:hypothetical protein [Rhodopirellula baltica]
MDDQFTMAMKDTFPHLARWDSVGLDCSFCRHVSECDWPNRNGDYRCNLHGISLTIQIANNGYKDGEWFCTAFADEGGAHPSAVEHLANSVDALDDNTLYRLSDGYGDLDEYHFSQLQPA